MVEENTIQRSVEWNLQVDQGTQGAVVPKKKERKKKEEKKRKKKKNKKKR